MDAPTTEISRPAGRPAAGHGRRRPPATLRRPGLLLGTAVAGALIAGVLVGPDPAAEAQAGTEETVTVAQALGLPAQVGPSTEAPQVQPQDLQSLGEVAASRGSREAAETAAQQAQAGADQAVRDAQAAAEAARVAAEAQAAAEAAAAEAARVAAEAEAAAAAERAEQEAASSSSGTSGPAAGSSASVPEEAPAASSGGTTASRVARITNTSGPVRSVVQAAADAVVSNVPGAASITLGGTRPSATDPGGHPSGLALDFMVMSDAALGDAIVQYHRDHWDELGVDYLIWEQRMLSSPGGSWKAMEDRGGVTANHFDHVHVNYQG